MTVLGSTIVRCLFAFYKPKWLDAIFWRCFVLKFMKSDWSKPLKQSGNYFDLFCLIQNVSFWAIFKPLYLMDSLQYGWDNQLQYDWDNQLKALTSVTFFLRSLFSHQKPWSIYFIFRLEIIPIKESYNLIGQWHKANKEITAILMLD